MSEKKRNFREGWWIRKAIYVVVAVAGVVATGFGFVSTEQVDAITASPVLATIVGLVAASFTNRGSDSPVTEEDVEVARSAAVVNPSEVAAQVVEQINNYGKHAAGVVKDKAEQTVADYYNRNQ